MRALMFAFLVAISNVASASLTYQKEINLSEPFGKNPFATESAFLRIESFGPGVHYWQPTTANLVGIVTYKFDVPFIIQTASIKAAITAYTFGSDANFDPGAMTYLDVSTDNVNWTNIASQTPSNATGSGIVGPFDITPHVMGEDTVYIRSRMFMSRNYGGFGTSQFMRSTPPFGSGLFSATAVPEPTTVVIWTILGVGLGMSLTTRRHRRIRGIQS